MSINDCHDQITVHCINCDHEFEVGINFEAGDASVGVPDSEEVVGADECEACGHVFEGHEVDQMIEKPVQRLLRYYRECALGI